jgi:hypothetical protein
VSTSSVSIIAPWVTTWVATRVPEHVIVAVVAMAIFPVSASSVSVVAGAVSVIAGAVSAVSVVVVYISSWSVVSVV